LKKDLLQKFCQTLVGENGDAISVSISSVVPIGSLPTNTSKRPGTLELSFAFEMFWLPLLQASEDTGMQPASFCTAVVILLDDRAFEFRLRNLLVLKSKLSPQEVNYCEMNVKSARCTDFQNVLYLNLRMTLKIEKC
jgi:hypothetical protein